MKRRLTLLSLLCTLICTPICTQVEVAGDFGPPVGSRFPVATLPDGRNSLGPKGAAILLYPSDGCPFCPAQLQELDRQREAFHKLGLGVAAVKDSSAAARPGWVILDARGVVTKKYFEDNPDQCYTSAAILLRQFGWIPAEPPREVEGKQLSANLGASNASAAPGQRITLTLDIDLQPNMHVYAPGVEGYIPIDWKMEDSATAQVHAPTFPRPEKLYLKAIAETVPAYRNHFRLTRDITINPAAGVAGHIAVSGSLRYQACDDRLCYIPQTLRLEWTLEQAKTP